MMKKSAWCLFAAAALLSVNCLAAEMNLLDDAGDQNQNTTIESYDLHLMEPIIMAYLDSAPKNVDNLGSYQTRFKKLSDREFWDMIASFAIHDSQRSTPGGMRSYSLEEVREIAAAMFTDFDGMLPDMPGEMTSNGFVTYGSNSVSFMMMTPEEAVLKMQEQKAQPDDYER